MDYSTGFGEVYDYWVLVLEPYGSVDFDGKDPSSRFGLINMHKGS